MVGNIAVMSAPSAGPSRVARPAGPGLRDRWDLTRRRHVDLLRCDSQGCRFLG